LDIEIGGEYAGIVQLAAESVRMKLVAEQGVAQDQVEDVVRVATFDSYVKKGVILRGIYEEEFASVKESLLHAMHNVER
jgi:hypothetical protein